MVCMCAAEMMTDNGLKINLTIGEKSKTSELKAQGEKKFKKKTRSHLFIRLCGCNESHKNGITIKLGLVGFGTNCFDVNTMQKLKSNCKYQTIWMNFKNCYILFAADAECKCERTKFAIPLRRLSCLPALLCIDAAVINSG